MHKRLFQLAVQGKSALSIGVLPRRSFENRLRIFAMPDGGKQLSC
jgi:hypothetical protein